jgi:hypothetical protein
MSDEQTNRFRYTAFSDNAKALDADITASAIATEVSIEKLPPGREKALALTKLEEAVMWARKALREA